LNNEEKVKWIKDYVDRATAVAWKQFQAAMWAIMYEQEDM
jgi:hypothetical protein